MKNRPRGRRRDRDEARRQYGNSLKIDRPVKFWSRRGLAAGIGKMAGLKLELHGEADPATRPAPPANGGLRPAGRAASALSQWPGRGISSHPVSVEQVTFDNITAWLRT